MVFRAQECVVCAFAGVRVCYRVTMCVLVGRREFVGVRAYRQVLCCSSEKARSNSCLADTLDMPVPGLIVGSTIHSALPASIALSAPGAGC